jgi:hypothetical protein
MLRTFGGSLYAERRFDVLTTICRWNNCKANLVRHFGIGTFLKVNLTFCRTMAFKGLGKTSSYGLYVIPTEQRKNSVRNAPQATEKGSSAHENGVERHIYRS